MRNRDKQALLCIPHGEKNYAIELSYVVEICFNLTILKIPRLPEYFQGVSNYKGVVVPVIELDNTEFEEYQQDNLNEIILILKTDKYQFGVLVKREPYIISVQEEEELEDYVGVNEMDRWVEKKIFQNEGQFYLLLDLEKTAENLVAYN